MTDDRASHDTELSILRNNPMQRGKSASRPRATPDELKRNPMMSNTPPHQPNGIRFSDGTAPADNVIDFASVVHARKGRSDSPAESMLNEADWRAWSFRAQMYPHAVPPSLITDKE